MKHEETLASKFDPEEHKLLPSLIGVFVVPVTARTTD
jgi:hypothetical protein